MNNKTKRIVLVILGILFVIIALNVTEEKEPLSGIFGFIAIVLFCYAFQDHKFDKKKDTTNNTPNIEKEIKKIYCVNCGNELNVNADFCLSCGTKTHKINETTKICKYCKTEIKSDATVCPNCRKTQNFSFGRVLIGVSIGLIILYFVFVANNDAPLEVRKVVCGLGLRDDYPYCYYVDTDKLNEILNK